MILTLNESDQKVPVYLQDNAGAPLAGLTLGEITMSIWRDGESGFVAAGSANPTEEIGSGWYAYIPTLSDVSQEGVMVYRAEHANAEEPGFSVTTVQPDPHKPLVMFRRPVTVITQP